MRGHDLVPESGEPAQDAAALDRLRRFGGTKLLGDMIALFLEAAPARIDAARVAQGTGDAAATELALHSLKSSSAQLGAMRMQRLSAEGEALARAGDVAGIARLVQALDEEFARVREWLTNVKGGGEG